MNYSLILLHKRRSCFLIELQKECKSAEHHCNPIKIEPETPRSCWRINLTPWTFWRHQRHTTSSWPQIICTKIFVRSPQAIFLVKITAPTSELCNAVLPGHAYPKKFCPVDAYRGVDSRLTWLDTHQTRLKKSCQGWERTSWERVSREKEHE